MAISMLKIRRPLGRLIFNMGIAIPGKTVFLIETAPSMLQMRAYRKRRSWIFGTFRLSAQIVTKFYIPKALYRYV